VIVVPGLGEFAREISRTDLNLNLLAAERPIPRNRAGCLAVSGFRFRAARRTATPTGVSPGPRGRALVSLGQDIRSGTRQMSRA
jgi:hypothetical protein